MPGVFALKALADSTQSSKVGSLALVDIKLKSLILFGILISELGLARIHLVFLSAKNQFGQPAMLEPNGRFSHVAFEIEGGFLHVHPQRGVEVTKDLSDLGDITETLLIEAYPDLQSHHYANFLGQPYDRSYRWDSQDSTYCSKLIGQILGIPPGQMEFSSGHWRDQKGLPRGSLGLSPDDIYRFLTKAQLPPLETSTACDKRVFSLPPGGAFLGYSGKN